MTFQYNKELIFQEFKVAADKDINTTKLAQIVSEAKETIIKYDFS